MTSVRSSYPWSQLGASRGHRLLHLAAWLAFALLLAGIWSIALPRTAYAYVDPSVMTYTIQALAGVAVALSAVAGVMFRRIRRKMLKTFNIDENAGKAIEGDIARISPSEPRAGEEFIEADKRASSLMLESAANSESRGLEGLSWPKRFGFALLMSCFAFFIIFVGPSYEIIAGNGDSLVFTLGDIWWISALINAGFALICALILSALRGKPFLSVLLLVFSLGLAAYVQSFFLNAGMMPCDGGHITWTDWYFVQKMLVSGLVWIFIIFIPQFACRGHRIMWLKVTSGIAIALMIMQGVGVASVAIGSSEKASGVDAHERPYVTQGDLFTVSPDDNVIVFLLDTYDTSLLEDALADNPDVLHEFTGFTYFRNSAGMMIPTQNAVPYLLSGQRPHPEETLDEYRHERYGRSALLSTIDELGYSIGLFTDSAMFDYSNPKEMHLARLAKNIHPMDHAPIDIWATYVVMDQMALYREAPWVAKPLFWYYTTDVNNRMIGSSAGSGDGHDELYEMNDAKILSDMREVGLAASDGSQAGAFRFIHLFGPHFPFSIDEDGNYVGEGNSDIKRQALGSLKVVEEYLSQLKELGLYDNATIIVAADHGIWNEKEDPIEHPVSPLLLVKPSTEEGGSSQPYTTSDMPIDHEDLAPTILQAMGADAQAVSSMGSGMTVWDIDDPARIRLFDALVNREREGRRIIEYQITGDVLDLDNWQKTETEWGGA